MGSPFVPPICARGRREITLPRRGSGGGGPRGGGERISPEEKVGVEWGRRPTEVTGGGVSARHAARARPWRLLRAFGGFGWMLFFSFGFQRRRPPVSAERSSSPGQQNLAISMFSFFSTITILANLHRIVSDIIMYIMLLLSYLNFSSYHRYTYGSLRICSARSNTY